MRSGQAPSRSCDAALTRSPGAGIELPPREASLHHHHDFSSRMAFLEIAERLAGFAQLVTPFDDRCHLPGLHEIAEDGEVVVVEIREHHAELLAHRSEEHTSELQSLRHLVCRLLLEK